jgi:hypothetical protein
VSDLSQRPDIPPRHEFKYLVSEDDAARIRAALRPFCELDRHSQAAADSQYLITSLYLDTPRHALYWASRMEQPGRMKVRARSYGAPGPVFLEVKRKHRRLIRKSRASVPMARWEGRGASPPQEVSRAEQDFWAQVSRHLLEPMTLVRYRREAWVGAFDDYARVTFDREVQFQPWTQWSLDGDDSAWYPMDDVDSARSVRRAVVVELKCPTAAPVWMERLASSLGLFRLSFSKYCTSIERGYGRRHPLGLRPTAPTYS